MIAMIRGLAMACILGSLLYALAVLADTPFPPVQAVDLGNAGWPAGALGLQDQHGRRFNADRLAGRWTFLVPGDSACAPAGRRALAALDGMFRRIDGTRAVATAQVAYVVLDAGDGRACLAGHDARFLAVTGTVSELGRLADELGLAVAGGATVLIGPDGVALGRLLPPYDVQALAAAFLRARARGYLQAYAGE